MATYSSNTTISKYSQTTNNGTLPSLTGTTTLVTVPSGMWAKGSIRNIAGPGNAKVYINGLFIGITLSPGQGFDFDNIGSDGGNTSIELHNESVNTLDFVGWATIFKNTP